MMTTGIKDKLVPMLGEDWYEVLSEYIHTQSFLDIGKFVAKERQAKTVWPKPDNVFRCLRETPFNKVKVVLIGNEPYTNEIANGRSFCCANTFHDTNEMRYILQEINNCYPENKFEISYSRLDRGDFSRLAKQGVLLLNRALTVAEKTPGSHMKQWAPFTDEVIKKLNEKGDIVFILLGKDAQTIETLLSGSSYIIKAPHPTEKDFIGSDVFRKCNEHLEAINKQIIHW
jgi:uracil-DNA glycosylase